MVKNVNRTARLQWKVDTIKKCIYLQCTPDLFIERVEFLNSKKKITRFQSSKNKAWAIFEPVIAIISPF